MIIDLLISFFLLAGSFFGVVASVGIVRLPDFLNRLQASTKASTLGIGFILIAVSLSYMSVEVSFRAFLIIGFIFLTSPIAAHMIARSAYRSNIPMWKKTVCDELQGDLKKEKKKHNSD